ncbi:MAG: FAD:protein FMN transferase [Planctomycetaceae bacterium]|nr:FAD:protein FMN transferase [Planctomycetaceae bacterium]
MTDSEKLRSRRHLLQALRPRIAPLEQVREVDPFRTPPVSSSTVRLSTRAMACDFSVIMNPGNPRHVEPAGSVLEGIHDVEEWLSIYRSDSLISEINRRAASEAVTVSQPMLELLDQAMAIHTWTAGAFDLASGALGQLWKRCRQQQQIPDQHQIDEVLSRSGSQYLSVDIEAQAVRFSRAGLVLDPGAIGKGFALDAAVDALLAADNGPREFLLHGGQSSLVARGTHHHLPGWPIGIGNPLLTNQRLGMMLLTDKAMSTSGSNIQFFRYQGRRYGHILDPQTGWPVEGMLSVTVVADSAAVADALSTAFFVMGIEKARACCDNLPGIGAILIPFPTKGRKVRPTVVGIPAEQLFWDPAQVELQV